MSAQMKFPRRTVWRALLATLTSVVVLGVAVPAANANVTVNPTMQGAGFITSGGGFFAFPTCDGTGNQNDDNVVSCAGSTLAWFFDVPVLLAATPAPTPAGHWQFVGWLGCSSVSGNICTINNPIQNVSAAPRAVFRDVVAPTITSITPVLSTSTDRGATFNVAANETLRSVTCSIDGGPEAACSTVRQFSEGNHTVRARGQDLSSNTAGALSAVSANFRIIDTQLVGGPTDFSSVKRPTFTFSSASGLDFRCSIDNAAITVPCGPKNLSNNRSIFTAPADLPDGVHTFRAQAFDGGESDLVPIVRTWTVDTAAPNTTLASPDLPEGVLTTLLTAAFTFTSTEVGTFQCRLAPAVDFTACTSPKNFADLAFGKQKFEVRSIDRAGNVDGSPAVRNWEIAAADNDSDGFNQRSDCNDADPAINPGRPEILDNDVDENCDGVIGVTPPPPPPVDNGGGGGGGGGGVAGEGAERILIGMPFAFSKSTKKFTTFTVLQIRAIPIGSKLKVTCKAPGKKKCPGGASFTKSNAFGTVSLKKWLKKKLLAGTKLTATVTKPGNFIGAVKIMTVKKKARPSFVDRCIAPGTTRAVGC